MAAGRYRGGPTRTLYGLRRTYATLRMLHRMQDVHTLGRPVPNRAIAIGYYKGKLSPTMATGGICEF